MHSYQIQRSEFVKLNENILEFKFDKTYIDTLNNLSTSKSNLKAIKDELSKIHILYQHRNDCANVQHKLFNHLLEFLIKIVKLKIHGEVTNKTMKIE